MAESHRPTPNAVTSARSKKRGRDQAFDVRRISKYHIMPINTINASKKSTTPANTDDRGITSRGKYILVIMVRLLTNERPASVRALEKTPHGKRPVYEKIG